MKKVFWSLLILGITLFLVLILTSSKCNYECINSEDWVKSFIVGGNTIQGMYVNDSIIYIIETDEYINWTQSGRVTKLLD